jgi:hypothetical protein
VDLSTFIVSVFCLADDWLRQRKLRSRGPAPKLSDSEVITMEVVGEFLGMDTDKAIYDYFRRHYAEWFPAMTKVHRTTFARQSANLWKAKEGLWQHLLKSEFTPGCYAHNSLELCIIDSLPMPVCHRARSHRCKIVSEMADYGRDTIGGGFFYGVRAHLLVGWPGVIVGASLAPASVHDLSVAREDLVRWMRRGWVLADRNYFSQALCQELERSGGPRLVAQYRYKKSEKEKGLRWPLWLVRKRRRIETVFSQLAGRFGMKKVWARDAWHLASRFMRKILSHTIAVLTCRSLGIGALRFSELLTH